MKYKIGDKVRIKSLDWYNENKASDDEIWCSPYWFGKEHSKSATIAPATIWGWLLSGAGPFWLFRARLS